MYKYCLVANLTLSQCLSHTRYLDDIYQLFNECKQRNDLAYQFKVQRQIRAYDFIFKDDMLFFKPAQDKAIELLEFSNAFENRIKAEIEKQQKEYEAMPLHEQQAYEKEEQCLIRNYNHLFDHVKAKKIDVMTYAEADSIEKEFEESAQKFVKFLYKDTDQKKNAIYHSYMRVEEAKNRKKKLQPYYDEVVNASGGYMFQKVKERAPEKLAEFGRLTKKRNKYLGGTDKPLWFLLLGIVMLVSGIVFCKEMMQGGEYLGIAGLYSTEGIGAQYWAFPLWTVALFLYLDIFNLFGILIVTHLLIPLAFIFEKLPFLHLVWPITGLIFFGLSVWSTWQDVMWSIYYNKAERYYKKHIIPLEDEIWKEVEEKYGDLVDLADRKSIKEYY